MKSVIIIATTIAVLVLGACAYMWLHQTPPAPATQTQNTGTQTDIQNRPVSVTASRTKDGAQAAFRAAMVPYVIEPLQLGATVIADNYALQVWKSGDMAGQGLLQYDSGQGTWIFITANGGAWSEKGLISAGVPSVTAEALLSGVSAPTR